MEEGGDPTAAAPAPTREVVGDLMLLLYDMWAAVKWLRERETGVREVLHRLAADDKAGAEQALAKFEDAGSGAGDDFEELAQRLVQLGKRFGGADDGQR